MTTEKINGMGETDRISIPDFIDALYRSESREDFWSHISHWRNALIIESAIRAKTPVSPRLEKAIKRRGERYFPDSHRMHAAKAYEIIGGLDKEHYARTGRHFKPFTNCRTSTQKEEFIFALMKEYDKYRVGHLHMYADTAQAMEVDEVLEAAVQEKA